MSILRNFKTFYFSPLVTGCIFFCLGIAFEARFKFALSNLLIISGIFFLSGLLSIKHRWLPDLILPGLVFFIGASVLANDLIRPADSVTRLTGHGTQKVTLRGIVVSDAAASSDKTSFVLSASFLKGEETWVRVSGEVFVRFFGRADYFYGEELIVRGNLYRYKGRYIISVKNIPGAIERTGKRGGFWLKRCALLLKHKAVGFLASCLSPFSASVLSAMLLGESRNTPPLIKELMVRTGTWHVLVVSGSHTALVAFILLIFFKLLRLPRKPRFYLTMGFLWLYCLMTGACAPVLRATIMTQLFLTGYLIERHPVLGNSLSLAGAAILCFEPLQLFNIGFQLSFLSVFFIVGLSARIKGIFPQSWLEKRGVSSAVNCFSVSMAAWLGTAPLLACAFGNFSPVTVLANMVVVPLAAVITMAGFVLLCLGSIFAPLSPFLVMGLEFLISFFFNIISFWAGFPWASFVFTPLPWLLAFVYYSLFLVIPAFFPKKSP